MFSVLLLVLVIFVAVMLDWIWLRRFLSSFWDRYYALLVGLGVLCERLSRNLPPGRSGTVIQVAFLLLAFLALAVGLGHDYRRGT